MENSLNLNFKFTIEPRVDIKNMSKNIAFQIASTLPSYTFEQIKNINDKISDNDIEHLRRLSTKISDDEYELSDEYRNIIINNTEQDDLINIVKKGKNPIQKHILPYLIGQNLDLKDQSSQELVKTLRISKWFKDTSYKLPPEDEILAQLQQHELLYPFKTLTRFFRGRKKELSQLSDYVDWLPKDGLIQNSRGIFRNIINWHTKPPLLLTGVGGIGKSSIIGEFILKNVEDKSKGTLPFIFFDFDRPGISPSDPYLLLSEGLRQLAIQFPDKKNILLELRKKIIETYGYESNRSSFSERGILYDYIEPYSNQFSKLNKPILVVFDSFEEIEYRTSKTQLSSLFDFLSELSSLIPRIRFVFAGRSEAGFEQQKFEHIKIEGFEEESALGFLYSLGIKDTHLQKQIFKKVGGNPLTLQLTANLISKQKTKNKLDELGEIKTNEYLFLKVDEKLIQKQLVERNLNHIHDEDVRKIAIPGMLVRKIDPDIIREILAQPCGLGDITMETANELYEKIQKETFLIERKNDFITFRQELRVSLYDLIVKKNAKKASQIHDRAIEYYSTQKDACSIAEYLYHQLKKEDSINIITKYYNDDIAPYFDYSIPELSNSAQLAISKLKGGLIAEEKIKLANQYDWEDYLEGLLRNTFAEGDLLSLQKAQIAIEERKIIKDPDLLCLKAKLYLRLGEWKKLSEVSTILLQEKDFTQNVFKYSKYIIQYHEYKGEYKKALELLQRFNYKENKDSIEYYLVAIRLSLRISDWNLVSYYRNRCEKNMEVLAKNNHNDNTFEIAQLFPMPYRSLVLNQEKKAHQLLNDFLYSFSHSLLSSENFNALYETLSNSLRDIYGLERLVLQNEGFFLKKICEPGVFEVMLKDVILYYEISGRLSLIRQDKIEPVIA